MATTGIDIAIQVFVVLLFIGILLWILSGVGEGGRKGREYGGIGGERD